MILRTDVPGTDVCRDQILRDPGSNIQVMEFIYGPCREKHPCKKVLFDSNISFHNMYVMCL